MASYAIFFYNQKSTPYIDEANSRVVHHLMGIMASLLWKQRWVPMKSFYIYSFFSLVNPSNSSPPQPGLTSQLFTTLYHLSQGCYAGSQRFISIIDEANFDVMASLSWKKSWILKQSFIIGNSLEGHLFQLPTKQTLVLWLHPFPQSQYHMGPTLNLGHNIRNLRLCLIPKKQ